jgi:hypothetical protein
MSNSFLDLVRSKYDEPEDLETDSNIVITVNQKFELRNLQVVSLADSSFATCGDAAEITA